MIVIVCSKLLSQAKTLLRVFFLILNRLPNIQSYRLNSEDNFDAKIVPKL